MRVAAPETRFLDLGALIDLARLSSCVRAAEAERKHFSFIHKWSGEARAYTMAELLPPDHVYYLSRHPFPVGSALVSIGGSRSPAAENFIQAHRWCAAIAENGYTIISGGVPGIDLAGHLGALEAGTATCKTIAVLANPVELRLGGHPWDSTLISNIMQNDGGFISEYAGHIACNTREFRERLLQRDRLITALGDAFIAFECSQDSATVDTAKRAYLQGKKVFAVRNDKPSNRTGVEQLLDEQIAVELKELSQLESVLERSR